MTTLKTHLKHYIIFESPGTLFSETSKKSIDSWDVKKGVEMARSITERHGSTPYCFLFKTCKEAEPIEGMDIIPQCVEQSGRYYLNGKVLTIDDIPDTAENKILRTNMRGNRMPFVVRTEGKYVSTHEYTDDDFVVDADTGEVTLKGLP